MKDNKFLVPLAIVAAGAMIAGAIYLGGDANSRPTTGSPNDGTVPIELSAVSNEDHIRGNSGAPIVIVEYSDIECPFCKVFHNTMKQVFTAYDGQVAWVYRHFPIPQLHQKAIQEAIATECAAEQGGNDIFWVYLDRLFETTDSNDSLDLAELPRIAGSLGLDVNEFNTCLTSGRYDEKIQGSMEEASRAGARGTPYSVLILEDALSKSKQDALNTLIAQKGLNASAVAISTDKKKVALGGALPLDLMRDILDTLLR